MLTPNQTKILEYIRQYSATHFHAPSLSEIAKASGLSSPSTVHHHLGVLQEQGFIERDPTRKRNITLTKASNELMPTGTPIPLRGNFTPSMPLERLRDQHIYLTTPTTSNYQPLFAVRLKTDLLAEHLLAKDTLIFHDTQTFSDHQIILCHLGNFHLLLKHAQNTSQGIKLTPIYYKSEPIITQKLHIVGRLLHTIRDIF